MDGLLMWMSETVWSLGQATTLPTKRGWERKHGPLRLFILFLIMCLVVSVHGKESGDEKGISCSTLVKEFSEKYEKIVVSPRRDVNHQHPPFVFFLHVPRTAGKTYSTCFLSASLRPSLRCMPGYDTYRYPQSPEHCQYYVSHDDLSFLDNLPDDIKDNVAVVTQLRDPAKRVISAYEFGIEVAGRKINTPDGVIENLKENTTTVNTYNVWPWKYIVPFARDFIRDRLDAILDEHGDVKPYETHVDPATNKTYYYDREKNTTSWEIPQPDVTLNAYDNELTMPLREWIETPVVEELIHNGHTLQILGISNTSFWEEAPSLRRCFFQEEEARRSLLELAKNKMSQMLHVGWQDDLQESVASLAASLGRKMDDAVYKSIPLKAYFYDEVSNIPDFDMMVTFNSSSGGGKYISLSIRNARYLMHNLTIESNQLTKTIKKKQGQLNAWLDKEERWMDRMEAERNSSLRWKFRNNIWRPLKQTAKWLRLYMKSTLLGKEVDEYEYEDTYDDRDQEELLQASPLNENITALDKEVLQMQERSRDVSRDYHELKKIPVVSGSPFGPHVRAYVPFPDESHTWVNKTLGGYFASCSRDSYNKGKRKRSKTFPLIRNEKNEGFAFGPGSQNQITEDVLSRIKELNAVDYELLEFGHQMFKKTIEAQKQDNLLEEIPVSIPVTGQTQKNSLQEPASRQHTEL